MSLKEKIRKMKNSKPARCVADVVTIASYVSVVPYTISSNLLLGFELIEKNQNSCTIENISEPTGEKYDSILKRIFFIIRETHDLILEDARKNKFDNFKEIGEIRDQQDRLILFCRRLITKERAETNPLLNWELLTFLMHIQHSYYYLYQYASKNKVKLSKETIDLLNDLEEYFRLYESSYFNKDLDSVNKINKLKTKYQFGECFKALEKSKGNETVILSYIREIYRLMQIGTSPILGEILEKLN